ncbi:CotH kinase family protein [Paenibacillus aurantiacus]|uniref:CotH kinase family protein n=1 Tax=Paenibacillus aurantiacus TaxID=1936118 RepID=A0ABV5KYK5_9BACL
MAGKGLPVRSIAIEPGASHELLRDVWSDRYVPARLIEDGKGAEARIRIRGGHTRNYLKKSYEIQTEGRTLHWNAEYDDPSLIRNALSFRFFNEIGVPAPRTRHVLLHWNGKPHGVYVEIEAVDGSFFRRRRIGASSLVYAVNDNADFTLIDHETKRRKRSLFSGYQLVKGGDGTKKRLASFITNVNRPASPALRAYLGKRLDIDQYLRWLAGAVLTNNYDGFDQNYALYEHRATNKYRIVPWDYEGTWGRNCFGRLCPSDLVPVRGMNTLTRKLLAYRSVRVRYRSLLKRLLNETFTTRAIEPIVKDMMDHIQGDVRDDFTRKWPFDTFLGEAAIISRFIRERREVLLTQLAEWRD